MSVETVVRRLAEVWWRELPELTWQVGALVLLVLGISGLCRRSAPQARYLMWLLVVLRLLVPVGLASPLGLLNDGSSGSGEMTMEVTFERGAEREDPVWPEAAPAVPIEPRSAPLFDLPGTAFLIWIGGVSLLTAAFLLRSRKTRRRLALLPPAPVFLARLSRRLCRKLGLRRHVEVRIDDDRSGRRLPAPAVFGWRRPVVVLPREMVEGWSVAELEPVLVHELLHVRRGDTWINALQCLLQVVYFFHPMVWIANRRIAAEREMACDDAVMAHYRDRADKYPRALFKMAATYRAAAPDPTAVAMARRLSGLGRRIERLAVTRGRAATIRRPVFSTLVLCAAGLIAASLAARRLDLAVPADATGPRPSAAALAAITAADPGPPPAIEDLVALADGEVPPETLLRWVAGHPRSHLVTNASGALDPVRDATVLLQAQELWIAQVEIHGDDGEIRGNAATFLSSYAPRAAEALLRQGQNLEPRSPEWPRRLARLYSRSGRPREALAIQERALQLAGDVQTRASILQDLPDLALTARDLDKARRYARELLRAAEEDREIPWRASNMRHRAHVTLGRLAWRAGSTAEASSHLLASVQVGASPQLKSFGPRLTLAQELLELGERDAVLRYLEVCASFWKRGAKALPKWSAAIARGEIPDLMDRSDC